MTDNEIKKALECCINDDCDNCPDTFGNCEHNVMRDALDLINRQQAEIERLTTLCTEQNEELGRLQKVRANILKVMKENISQTKAEAINEFAERLKATDMSDTVGEQYINGEMYSYFYSNAFTSKVDNLVKEMTEVNENG